MSEESGAAVDAQEFVALDDWEDAGVSDDYSYEEAASGSIEAVAEEAKEETSEAGSEDKQASEETEEGTKEPESEDSEVKEDNKEEEVKGDPEDAQESEVELLNSKNAADKMAEVVIDGETVQVPVQDLINSYSGKVAYDKKFSELDKERKEYNSELEEVNGYLSNFGSKLKDGDVVGAFQYFGEFAGVPSYMIKEQLVAALKPEIERRSLLSGDEIQNEMLSAQNDYLKDQRESDVRRRESEASRMELQSKVNSIRETHSIEDAEWQEATSYLEKHVEEGREITPELTQEFIISDRAYGKAESLITEFDAKLKGNEEWTDALHKIIIQNPEFSDDELREVITEGSKRAKADKAESKLKERIEKKESRSQEKKINKQSADSGDANIDPELEDWL